jgi:hypothetical protein
MPTWAWVISILFIVLALAAAHRIEIPTADRSELLRRLLGRL